MSNGTLVVFLLMMAGRINAQPVISMVQQTPEFGSIISTVSSNYIDPGDPGQDLIWDFSEMTTGIESGFLVGLSSRV